MNTKCVIAGLVGTTLTFSACSGPIGFSDQLTGYPAVLSVQNPENGALLTSFETDLMGTCSPTETFIVAPTSSGITVVSSTCQNHALSIRIAVKPASSSTVEVRSLDITNGKAVLHLTYYFGKQCPANFVGVPGHPGDGIGTSDFCLSKYEMKNNGSGSAVSEPAGLPWAVELDGVAGAVALCQAQSFSVPTNAQWQTMARNLESRLSNWISDGGTMRLPRGAAQEAAALAASPDDAQGCFGILGVNADCSGALWGSGLESRRTMETSAGEVIWDLGGNRTEWVNETAGTSLVPAPSFIESGAAVTYEFDDSVKFPANSANRIYFSPSGTFGSTPSTFGIGQIVSADFNSYAGGVLRGGEFNDGPIAGIFATKLPFARSGDVTAGFRCATTPF